jgi:hypothetical protein
VLVQKKTISQFKDSNHLLSGTVATLARDVPASAAYYASYELIQRRLAPNGDRYSFQANRRYLEIYRDILYSEMI